MARLLQISMAPTAVFPLSKGPQREDEAAKGGLDQKEQEVLLKGKASFCWCGDGSQVATKQTKTPRVTASLHTTLDLSFDTTKRVNRRRRKSAYFSETEGETLQNFMPQIYTRPLSHFCIYKLPS